MPIRNEIDLFRSVELGAGLNEGDLLSAIQKLDNQIAQEERNMREERAIAVSNNLNIAKNKNINSRIRITSAQKAGLPIRTGETLKLMQSALDRSANLFATKDVPLEVKEASFEEDQKDIANQVMIRSASLGGQRGLLVTKDKEQRFELSPKWSEPPVTEQIRLRSGEQLFERRGTGAELKPVASVSAARPLSPTDQALFESVGGDPKEYFRLKTELSTKAPAARPLSPTDQALFESVGGDPKEYFRLKTELSTKAPTIDEMAKRKLYETVSQDPFAYLRITKQTPKAQVKTFVQAALRAKTESEFNDVIKKATIYNKAMKQTGNKDDRLKLFNTGLSANQKIRSHPVIKDALTVETQFNRLEELKHMADIEETKPLKERNYFIIDNFLITLARRLIDTQSSVREEEYARIPQGQSLLNRALGAAQKMMSGGERLMPEDRQALFDSAQAIRQIARRDHNKLAVNFRRHAGQAGLDPDLIIPLLSTEQMPTSVPLEYQNLSDEELLKRLQ